MFEAESQNFAAAPSAQRGFEREKFWPAVGRDHMGTLGGGGSQPNPPPPLLYIPGGLGGWFGLVCPAVLGGRSASPSRSPLRARGRGSSRRRHRAGWCTQGGGGVSTWASRTQKHSEAGYGRPVDRGAWAATTVKRPRQQPAHPQYANYWAPLTRKRHTMPHSAQPQHTNYWAPRTRKRHQQEHRPQRPTESSNPTQHAKGRTGDCPGPRKGTTTRRNVT